MSTQTQMDVRPSPLAGQWYPAVPDILAQSVDAYLDVPPLPIRPEEEVVALIAPHAGHMYSGMVAGHAFAAVKGRSFDIVAVLSPMHHPYPAAFLTTGHQAYGTPLGVVPVDRDLVREVDARLQEAIGLGLTPVRNDPEHALEIELPFLQRALRGPWRLLPIMIRDQRYESAKALGLILAEVLADKNALLVASTDLSHYYPQHIAEVLDREMLKRWVTFDPEAVFRAEEQGVAYACGRLAVVAVLWASRKLGATRVQVLYYATSGDVTGDRHSVVGYAAAAVLR